MPILHLLPNSKTHRNHSKNIIVKHTLPSLTRTSVRSIASTRQTPFPSGRFPYELPSPPLKRA